MDYTQFSKMNFACRNSSLFGHQKPNWSNELEMPSNYQYKEHNSSSCGCRYNHMHDVNMEVNQRIAEIHRSPINVSIFSEDGWPVCERHRKVITNVRQLGFEDYLIICPECEREKKLMNSHPKQMSREECILEDIRELDRILFRGIRFNRDTYADGWVFFKDVELWMTVQMRKASIMRLL